MTGQVKDPSGEHHKLFGCPTIALFLAICLIYLAFLKPGIWGVDGNDMLHMSQSLIQKGNFSVPAGTGGIEGPDGQFYSIRYPMLPIVAIPFVWTGMTIGEMLSLPVRYTSATLGLVLNILLTAATAGLVYGLTLRLGGQRRGAFIAVIGYAFGTTAMVYAREFFAEPLLAFIITLALYLAFGKSRWEHWPAGLLVALAIATKPAGVLLGPVLAGYFLLRRCSWDRILAPCIGTVVGIGLYLGYNYIRFGSFLKSGQDTSQLGTDGFLMRALGQLISPGSGGGLFWYCPPTILAIVGLWVLWQKRKLEFVAIFGIVASFWLLHSGWDFNGWNWGPRFLVPIIPALMVTVGLLDKRWRLPLIGLITLGFLANAPILLTYYQRYFAEVSDQSMDLLMQTVSLWSEPSQAPIFNVWAAAGRQLSDAFNTPVQDIIRNVGEPPPPGEFTKAELLRIVAVWWWFLPAVGIPIWVGVAIALTMVGIGIWLFRFSWLSGLKPPVRLKSSQIPF
ncbi:MAG: glycosyltransferase 87 family protein [Cyanobacteria bacterium P01_H01_bin.21]